MKNPKLTTIQTNKLKESICKLSAIYMKDKHYNKAYNYLFHLNILFPQDHTILTYLAVCSLYIKLHPIETSITHSIQALKIKLFSLTASLCLVECKIKQEKYFVALYVLSKLQKKYPHNLKIYLYLGQTYLNLGQHKDSLSYYNYVLQQSSDSNFKSIAAVGVMQNYLLLGNKQLAIRMGIIARRLNPLCPYIRYELFKLCFVVENYSLAWRLFESRKEITPNMYVKNQLWASQKLERKTLLIYTDGGLGDSIQFSRYLSILVNIHQNCNVVVVCETDLLKLFRNLYVGINFYEKNKFYGHFDYQISLQSLPFALNTNSITNVPTKHIKISDNVKNKFYKNIKQKTDNLKVGIVWKVHNYPKMRSMPIELLVRLTEISKITWYSLQYNGCKDIEKYNINKLIDLDAKYPTLLDKANIIPLLDLIISVDTCLAHLSGHICHPVWLLLMPNHDYRWISQQNYSVWYNSMRIFKMINYSEIDIFYHNIYRALTIESQNKQKTII